MRVGLDSFSYRFHVEQNGVEWFIDRVVELGFDGCQLDPAHLGDWNPGLMSRLAGFCQSNGLYLELGWWNVDAASLSERLEIAQDIGARAVRTFVTGRGETPERLAELSSFAVGELRRVAETAERLEVPVAVENHEDYTSIELEAIIRRVGSPMIGACLDTGNGVYVGEDALESVRRLAPYALATHLKDLRRVEGPERVAIGHALGEGELPVKEMLSIIRAAKPDLPITIEAPSDRLEDEDRVVEASIAWMRSQESD